MSLDDFWYDEEELLNCYAKAYQRNIDCVAWTNGLYTLRAVESAINNVMPLAVGIGMGGGKIKPIEYFDKPLTEIKEESDKEKEINEKESVLTEEGMMNGMKKLNIFIR